MDEQNKSQLARRRFLTGIAACSTAAMIPKHFPEALFAQHPEAPSKTGQIAEIFLDTNKIRKWNVSNGDTWDPFWADDDNLYAFNCDGRGFGVNSMNLAFNRLSGDSPSSLVGTPINDMGQYGKISEKGPDNATWKACGQECIDGVFYAFVSRNVYGSDSKDPLLRQLALNCSLIKSTDRGLTWTRTAKENYDRPMWPGSRFGAPFFVHYGQNGGQTTRDGASKYVYAVSTNGYWNDGDKLTLGRVQRSQLSNLKSSDWEYYTGGDGSIAKSWSQYIENAVPVLDRPAKCGQTPICYIPELGIYLLISWYNPRKIPEWYKPDEMHYDFYQAEHPWGPWNQISSFSDRFMGPGYHMYGPSLCAKFQKRQGTNIEISLFTSGCPFEGTPGSPYKMWHIPVTLRTVSLPTSTLVAASDKQLHYHGLWFPLTAIEDAEIDKLPRATQTKESAVELFFDGTGIEYIAQKTKGLGSVDIYLDGMRQESASLDLEDFPVFFGVVVFSKQGLPKGKHVIKIVSTSEARVNIEAFRVFA